MLDAKPDPVLKSIGKIGLSGLAVELRKNGLSPDGSN